MLVLVLVLTEMIDDGDRLGLGAPLPKDIADGDGRRGELSSNARLRRQLLGREMARIQGRGGAAGKGGVGGGGRVGLVRRPRPAAAVVGGKRRVDGDDGEEEEEEEEREGGRSSVGKAKRRIVDVSMGGDGVEEVDGGEDGKALRGGKMGAVVGEGGRKAAGSYLDQVLAEKSLKKMKKKKRRKEGVRA